ncbi:MAG: transposase [Cryobacterium sp.]|nr:transposase [Cryobacterium sp.]
MPALKKYPPRLKERAVRVALGARDEEGDYRGACSRVGQQLGIPVDTLRGWVYWVEIDQGLRHGTTTDDATRLVDFEWENLDLRRATAILKSASAVPSGA